MADPTYYLTRARSGGLLHNEDWDKGRWYALYLHAALKGAGEDGVYHPDFIDRLVRDHVLLDERFALCFSWARYWPVDALPLVFLWLWMKSGNQAELRMDVWLPGRRMLKHINHPTDRHSYEARLAKPTRLTDRLASKAPIILSPCFIGRTNARVEDLEYMPDLSSPRLRRIK